MRLLVLLAALTASVASAGDPGAWFRKLDRNRDGYLDRKELSSQRRVLEVFDQADENKDGRLDPDEFIRAESLVQEMKRRPRADPDSAGPAKKEETPG